MSMQCSLDNAVLNFKFIRDSIAEELLRLIDEVEISEKNKILVLDPALSGLLNLVVDFPALTKKGIEKIYFLNPGVLPTEAKHIIYLIRPRIKFMKYIAQQIRGHSPTDEKTYNIFFVPVKRTMCEVVLEEEGVKGKAIRISEYGLCLVPFDTDILSMELPTSFRECAVDGDKTSLYYIAKALMNLQNSFGVIPTILGKGANAQFITEMLFRMRHEANDEEKSGNFPEITHLIIIDREVDFITPMCTQLTYEGLIDEVFGINNGSVELPAEMVLDPKTENKEPPGKKLKTPLNSNDRLFSDIRDLNFASVGPHLHAKAKLIDEHYKERYAAKTITEIKDFMKKLTVYQKEHQYLRIQSNITESVLAVTRDLPFRDKLAAEQNLLALADPDVSMAHIEKMINKQEPINAVLRLLCLYSLTNNGIKDKFYNVLKRDILQTYGYKYLYTLENLTKIGMFKLNATRANPYAKTLKDLNLIIEEMNDKEPNDIAYVYSGYAPISIRIVEQAIASPAFTGATLTEEKGFFNSNSEKDPKSPIVPLWGDPRTDSIMRDIPGPHFHAKQPLPKNLLPQDESRKVVLVFFVGGCTYTEISAIRFLNQKHEGIDFLVGTTKIINGNGFFDSVTEKVGKDV
uniref:Uncharacterized protein n=1 Tax=Arcella intermedia TaxID=1963864 RepID=A0A6B2KZZ3_9EUKA|eukprot:TRINITY_DN525_c0_g1_i1.p1 TRINITY_DN525_c0_g1~~TRINITY_DN525_c0_g1_i1.p1  ORF type:complete len:630 (+),score=183.90 TRINITY_DN525_c0_g1_i1:3-1892(+)